MKTALEIRDAIKTADSLLQNTRWDLVDNIADFRSDDIEQIEKVAQFVKAKADELILTANDEMWRRQNMV
jgi:endonuclease III-like uncharacterized protein